MSPFEAFVSEDRAVQHVASLRDLSLGAVALLAQGSGAEADWLRAHRRWPDADSWSQAVNAALRDAVSDDFALADLALPLQLTRAERLAVALAAAVDELPMAGRALAWLQMPLASARPSLGLIARAFAALGDDEAATTALAGGNAVASGLLALSGEASPLPERTLSLPLPLLRALRDADASWPGVVLGEEQPVPLMPRVLEDAQRRAQALAALPQAGLTLRSASVTEARAVAAVIADALALRAVFIDATAAASLPRGFEPWLIARRLLPVFLVEAGPGERKTLPTLTHYRGPMLAITGLEGSIASAHCAWPDWLLPMPDRAEREALWHSALGDVALAAELARDYRQGSGRIAQLGRVAQQHALAATRSAPTREDLRAAAWTHDAAGLDGLAEPMPEPVPDEAFIVSPALRAELDLLLARCRARDGLADTLGSAARTRYRSGVRALLTGPSGTGKSLAAQWLATRIGLPIYRVDLASITSKWIGETEKNLAQLLSRAEHADAVLLFDEADALFGKRTDVSDAHDRYANAQTNYLLQRIESFDGIVVLTSNARSRFDSAFTRRLDAIIEFALPDAGERRGLWLAHLGQGHALRLADINRLAALGDLAGGHIRNATLTAAILARARGGAIAWAEAVEGLAVEYRKLGRPVPVELRG